METGTVSCLARGCRECPHVKTCDKKRKEKAAYTIPCAKNNGDIEISMGIGKDVSVADVISDIERSMYRTFCFYDKGIGS